MCDTPAQSRATDSNVWCRLPGDSCSIDNAYPFLAAADPESAIDKSTYDPSWSFMDYSADDCMTRFSPGQAVRLREQIELYKPKAAAVWAARAAAHPNSTAASCTRPAVGVATVASCTGLECPADDFTCASDAACVPKQELCDCTPNCVDGSDESAEHAGCDEDLCSDHCEPTEWECADGLQCIHAGYRCDGLMLWEPDCIDGSDELNCDHCPDGWHRCGGDDIVVRADDASTSDKSVGACIKDSWLCDGQPDCATGSDGVSWDESDCTTAAPSTTSTVTPLPSHEDCPSHLHWMCPASDPPQCIRKKWVCDGFSTYNPLSDCANLADETPERCGSGGTGSIDGYYSYDYGYGSGFDWANLCPQENAVPCCSKKQCVFDLLWGTGICDDGSDLEVQTPGQCSVTPAPRVPTANACSSAHTSQCRRGNRWV